MLPASLPILIPILPELFMALSSMFLLMVGAFSSPKKSFNLVANLGYIVVIITIILLINLIDNNAKIFGSAFITDNFAVYMKVLILLSVLAIMLISRDYLVLHGIEKFEFSVLFLLSSLGMMMMISANDLLALYLGIELQSLALYVFAAFHRDSSRSAEAGLKYFILGALSSGLMLYGMSLVYGFSGSTSYESLSLVLNNLNPQGISPGLVIGLVFILAGLAFKISAVPFHMWTPDVYEGAPTPITAFFSVAPKIAAMGLLIRLMAGPFGSLGSQWQQIIIFISIASMVLGAFAAINQKNIKRLMAYSSIGHVGYALIGLAVAGIASSSTMSLAENGVLSILVYMGIYVFTNIGTFSCILLMKRNGRMVEEISDLAGLSKTNPGLAVILSIFMFSMAGIPPLAGFMGKLYVFQIAIEAELFVLALIGVLTSVVSAFYYIRIIKIIYFDDSSEPLDTGIAMEIKSVLIVTGAFVLFFIFYSNPLITAAEQAASSLFIK
ncbi:MAG: NADH-quinone oxidoreductase subunit NuoN [Rhodospirillales bacterium]